MSTPRGVTGHVDPWIGRVVGGRYTITARVARGSTGVVYEAIQHPLGRATAVKMLDAQSTRSPRARARFQREAALLGRLTHPNTVRIYDYGNEGSTPWIAMEFCIGSSLAEMMGAQPMDPLRLTRIVQQVCASLQEAHGVGLVHRDLKPANILVQRADDGSDWVKVLDFGLVKPVENAEQLTAKGLLVGTPMYMSPEQVRGLDKIDQRSDLYALGMLLYRGLSGGYPFPTEQTAAVLLAHLQERPAPLPPDLPIPRSLATLVEWLLEKHPDQRPSTVREVREHLSEVEQVLIGAVADAEVTATMSPTPVPPSRRPAAPRRQASAVPVVILLIVMGLMAIVGGVLIYFAAQS